MSEEREICCAEHPLLAIDVDGEIPVRCGLVKGHAGEHSDSRFSWQKATQGANKQDMANFALRDLARHSERRGKPIKRNE